MAKKRNQPNKTVASPIAVTTRKSVDVRKADNGFVVSSWNGDSEKCFIAKTKQEATAFANKLLGMK